VLSLLLSSANPDASAAGGESGVLSSAATAKGAFTAELAGAV